MKMLGGSIWFYTFLPEVQVKEKYLTSHGLLKVIADIKGGTCHAFPVPPLLTLVETIKPFFSSLWKWQEYLHG